MFKHLVMLVSVSACSYGPEVTSELMGSGDASGEAPVSFVRADANEDGTVDIDDLIAVSWWIGKEPPSGTVERDVFSALQKNPEIAAGRLFSVEITASLDYGARWAKDFQDASSASRPPYQNKLLSRDESCRVTVEVVAVDSDGKILDNAIANPWAKSSDSLNKPRVVNAGAGGYNLRSRGFFTDNAIGKVSKLVAKSGSICNNRIIPLTKVAEIPVNVIARNDDLVFTATIGGLTNDDSLKLDFDREPSNGKELDLRRSNMRTLFIDGGGMLKGSVKNGTVYSYLDGSARVVTTGTTIQPDHFQRTVYHFGYYAGATRNGRNQQPFDSCGDDSRVWVLITKMKKNSHGMLDIDHGKERFYEASCIDGN